MNVKMRIFILIFLILFCVSSAFALELTEGRIKLILHENYGRFAVYYLSDVSNDDYMPLFLDEDPRTSFLSILEGNRSYRMGESSNFSQSIQKTSSGAQFVWESNTIIVKESFSFIRSSDSALANGIVITVSIENISEQDINAGIRYVFDTYIGESSADHFITDENTGISKETEFTQSSMPTYVVSAKEDLSEGLQFMTKGDGITTPDKVVLANWKRLNDTSWVYTTNQQRSFNQLPYSINDSAIALYYSSQQIDKSETREITLVLGNYSPNGFSTTRTEQKSEISEVFKKALSTDQAASSTEKAVQNDLLTLRDLLKKINTLLESDEEISQSDIEVLRQVVEELKKRKTRYENR